MLHFALSPGRCREEGAARRDMAEAEPVIPTDYVRIKRKRTTTFLYIEPMDTVHDLRAKINHITKVPTTDVKFFIDKDGEVAVDENKTLADQKASRARLCAWQPHAPAARENVCCAACTAFTRRRGRLSAALIRAAESNAARPRPRRL